MRNLNFFYGLAFQTEASDSSMWIILAVVLVILFFIVVIIGVGLTIFFVMRRRSKKQAEAARSGFAAANTPAPQLSYNAPPLESPLAAAPQSDYPAQPRAGAAVPPTIPDVSSTPESVEVVPNYSEGVDFSRTVAIARDEETGAIDYGTIKFVSGVLAGEQFEVKPEGSYIGRESTLSQIVVADPRISKRHLWIGIRDGAVTIVDEGSRNGTFVNDPKSPRVTETSLKSGDTVILGESDVARFEYQK